MYIGGNKLKKFLRNKFLKLRTNMDKNEKRIKDEKIIEYILNNDLYKNAKNIFVFVSMDYEINTHELIKKAILDKKNVYIPYIKDKYDKMHISPLKDFDNDLEKGYFDVLSVKKELLCFKDKNILDLVITPALAFNKNGFRIGYGGGYYDIFFEDLKDNIKKLGICYDFQIIDENFEDSFDISVDYLITESGFKEKPFMI